VKKAFHILAVLIGHKFDRGRAIVAIVIL